MKWYEKISGATVVLAGILSFAASTPTRLCAQHKVSDVRVTVYDVRQEKDSIRTILGIEMLGISVSPREQVFLFPAIRYQGIERRLPPVVINGTTQQNVINRAQKLSGITEHAYRTYTAGKGRPLKQKIEYTGAVPAEEWMKDAHIAMIHERGNCRGEVHRVSMEVIADRIRFAEKPVRQSVYLLPAELPVPPREEIKIRSESGEAHIIYTVNNAEIKPHLADNMNELEKIRRSIEDIRNREGIKINSITISAYASPEGKWQNNLNLSERRAASLALWIHRNYSLGSITLSSGGYGEDWDGLARLVEDDMMMSGSEKQDVLQIIESMNVFDGREKVLMDYSGGHTYRYMLANLFPKLRRSIYRIEFTVPEYTLETIDKVFKTHPNMLSLHEFYLLANQYEPGSPQFREVIEKASSIYPGEKINRISMAMFSYLSNDISRALEYLGGMEDDPDAWLYFATFHARNNELDKAEHYALKALEAGNPNAPEHLKLLEKYKSEENAYQEKLREWEKYGIDE